MISPEPDPRAGSLAAGGAARSVGSGPGHLVLVGPTASGKSAVSMSLALLCVAGGSPVEIVSCDSMQVYRGMDIGTAKATAAERAEIPHHMLDLVEPSEDHDLARFLDAARDALSGIEARGSRAVLVGGTGLYVRALVDGFSPPPHFADLRAELEALDTHVLGARLAELDPVAMSRIPRGNRRRLIRALEVTIGTGVRFSDHGVAMEHYPPTPLVMCGLRPQRDVMGEAISRRFDAQLEAGFLAEVERLRAIDPPMSRTARQALGYRELSAHLDGEVSLSEAAGTAKVRTRRFAVRQLRWFDRDPRIEWFDPPAPGRGPGAVAAELAARWSKSSAGSDLVATSFGATELTVPQWGPPPTTTDTRSERS